MVDSTRRTMGLKTQANELSKSYATYDGLGRLTAVYTAHTDAANGAPCTIVTYEYVDATSLQVKKMKEDDSTWSSTYDI